MTGFLNMSSLRNSPLSTLLLSSGASCRRMSSVRDREGPHSSIFWLCTPPCPLTSAIAFPRRWTGQAARPRWALINPSATSWMFAEASLPIQMRGGLTLPNGLLVSLLKNRISVCVPWVSVREWLIEGCRCVPIACPCRGSSIGSLCRSSPIGRHCSSSLIGNL